MPDIRHKQIAEFIAPFRVKPGKRVVLARDFDPAFTAGVRKGGPRSCSERASRSSRSSRRSSPRRTPTACS